MKMESWRDSGKMWAVKRTERGGGFNTGEGGKEGAKDDCGALGPLGGCWYFFRGRDFARPQVGWFEVNQLVWGRLKLRCL